MAKRKNEAPNESPAPTRRRTGGTRAARKIESQPPQAEAASGQDLPSALTAAAPSQDAIARRAHELYIRRGATDGHDIDDWLEAERQLRDSPDR